jgi:hypothetical protein
MLAKLHSFISGKDQPKGGLGVERFGEAIIARRFGEEILRATPERRNHLQAIRDRLSSMTLEEKDELVDRLFARLALFVYDLPASKANHHSGRFGLLDHLLEVAHQTVRELAAPGFQVSPEPSTNHRERPLWVYAGLVAAVAHDIGKPLDLEIAAPGKGTCWDPRVEPLRLFCQRHGLAGTGPELWHFLPRRGLRGHETNTPVLLPLVLTPEVAEYLGPRLASVTLAMTKDEEWKPTGGRWHPATEVVRVVRRIDGATAKDDVDGDREKKGEVVRKIPRDQTVPAPIALQSPKSPAAPSALKHREVALAPARSAQPLSEAPVARSGEDVEEEPLVLPPDFWGEHVPHPRERRGDPVETERHLQVQLDPARFMDTLRRMVVSRRLSRNNYYTEVYIRPDYVWFMLPRALRRVALINRLPYDTGVLRRMLASLKASPQVAPGSERRVPVFMKFRPDATTMEAVRVKTQGFLSETDLACLGVYGYDLKALDTNFFLIPAVQG